MLRGKRKVQSVEIRARSRELGAGSSDVGEVVARSQRAKENSKSSDCEIRVDI